MRISGDSGGLLAGRQAIGQAGMLISTGMPLSTLTAVPDIVRQCVRMAAPVAAQADDAGDGSSAKGSTGGGGGGGGGGSAAAAKAAKAETMVRCF